MDWMDILTGKAKHQQNLILDDLLNQVIDEDQISNGRHEQKFDKEELVDVLLQLQKSGMPNITHTLNTASMLF